MCWDWERPPAGAQLCHARRVSRACICGCRPVSDAGFRLGARGMRWRWAAGMAGLRRCEAWVGLDLGLGTAREEGV